MTNRATSLSLPVEVWFDFASTYSYLSIMRIETLAQPHQVRIQWKPFLLGPIFKSLGWETSPFLLQQQKGAYMWRDVERECLKYGIAWQRPTHFPRRALLPTRVALLAAEQPWMAPFCRAVMQLNFVRDREIDTFEAVTEALGTWVPDVDALVTAAQLESTKERLRQQTEEARRRGIFGAPTFFVGQDMYWGNDRLEDAIRLAAGIGQATRHQGVLT